MRPRLISTMVAFGILMLAGAQSAAAQTVPATLTGEIFTISPPQVATNCNPTGTSTVSYAVSGLAVGPYAGPYTETGTFTIGPETLPRFVNGFEFGPVTSFSASFTVSSPTGQVTGSKRLTAVNPDVVYAACYTDQIVDMCACAFGLTYDATITDSTGAQYGDTGNSGMTLIKTATEASFMEAMVSSLLTPFPICVEDADGDNGPACDNDGDGQ